MRKMCCLLLLVALVLVPLEGLATGRKLVRLATLTGFPPYCFAKPGAPRLARETIRPGEDSVQLQGYSWDVVRQSFQLMDYTIELQVVPWARVVHYLRNGRVDAIFPANRTAEREQIYLFSAEYVDSTPIVVYVRADSTLAWDGIATLAGRRVGVVRSWAYGKKWEDSDWIAKESTDTISQSFLLLEKERLDAVVGYEYAYDFVLTEEGRADRFRKLGRFDVIEEYLMGLRREAKTSVILDAFDQGHALLKSRGILDAIEKTWQADGS